MSKLNKILTVTAAVLAIGGGVVIPVSPASAAARNGVCEVGEFCYYYNSDHQGSVSDFAGSEDDYGTEQPSCFEFKGPGNGQGKCIKNEAASAWNRSSVTVRVYFNSNFGGVYQDFAAGAKVNLNASLKNNNASHQFSPSSRVNMSYALYKASGGRLTTPFDGYESTPGRHEGIDFARSAGSSIYALVSGKVINVEENGSALSTIAIYNASLDKTVIYLHANPSVSENDTVSRGQVIGLEASRGASSAHTHVEMRPGRKTNAAKSVGDPVLDNPDPTAFWNSQGYDER